MNYIRNETYTLSNARNRSCREESCSIPIVRFERRNDFITHSIVTRGGGGGGGRMSEGILLHKSLHLKELGSCMFSGGSLSVGSESHTHALKCWACRPAQQCFVYVGLPRHQPNALSK